MIAQFFYFVGNIVKKSWETPSSLFTSNPSKVTERPANLHKTSKETRDHACQLITVPALFYWNKVFELRLESHKIKQINAPLRFTNVAVLVCLIKVINIISEQKSACTFTDNTTHLSIKTDKITFFWMLDPVSTLSKKPQNYRGAIQPCIVYWGSTNLKDEYAPIKTWIKILMSLGQFCCSQQT